MPNLKPIIAAAVLSTLPMLSAQAETALSDAQKREVEAIVRDYIAQHPEAVLKSLMDMERRAEAEEADRQKAAILELQSAWGVDGGDPFVGDANGDVTVVEFFDYRCGFCKRGIGATNDLVAGDKRIRFVFKEFPILGPESVLASRAALSVWRHQADKYAAFHTALMTSKGQLDEARIVAIAHDVGVDALLMEKHQNDPDIDAILIENRRQAQALGINGTPAFIVGSAIRPGAADLEELKEMVAAARAEK
ncbi:MAG: DsbA family protein [Alphaproteobacteria bacterium]|nr:DsbA family protein [Alphaproteobacteria bacterium]